MSYPYAGGSNKPVTKIWHPMWGLWLVVSNTEAQQHQQQPLGWPVADPKVVQKSLSFNEKNTEKCMTFQQQPTGQLLQCTIPSQSAASSTLLRPCA